MNCTKTVAFLFIINGMNGFCQPRVSLAVTDTLLNEGLRLLSAESDDFKSAVRNEPTELREIFNYSAVLKNDSRRDLIGYSVTWFCTDEAGRTLTPEVTIWNAASFRSVLPVGAANVVSNLVRLGTGVHWDQQTQAETLELVRLFSKQREIVISLEAVLFSDGTALGPDRNQWIPRWKAYIDAERDVFSGAVIAGPYALHEYLGNMAQAGVQRASHIFQKKVDSTDLHWAARKHAHTYEDAYELFKAAIATDILAEVSTHDAPDVISSIRVRFESKKYPAVRRKEYF